MSLIVGGFALFLEIALLLMDMKKPPIQSASEALFVIG